MFDGAMDRVVWLQHDHKFGIETDCGIIEPPKEGPWMPAIVRRWTHFEGTTFLFAEGTEVSAAITHHVDRRSGENFFEFPHLIKHCSWRMKNVQIEAVELSTAAWDFRCGWGGVHFIDCIAWVQFVRLTQTSNVWVAGLFCQVGVIPLQHQI